MIKGVAKIASRIEITGLAAGVLGSVSSAEGDTEISVGSGAATGGLPARIITLVQASRSSIPGGFWTAWKIGRSSSWPSFSADLPISGTKSSTSRVRSERT
ncbi:MAG: hypothetical protein ACXQT2_07155 [Methanotrichaceae archaeon]